MANVFQRRNQGIQIVAINRANVIKAKLFKQRGGHDQSLGMFFKAFGQLKQRGRAFEHAFAHVLGFGIKLPAHQLRQIAVERAHRRADAHFVVVQDHEQFAVFNACIVQSLKRHACCQCAVANHGDAVAVVALDLGGHGHAQRCRDGRAGVRRAKGVEFAFGPLRKTTQAAQLAQRCHTLAPTRQNFVGVGLVADVPHHAVFGCVKNIVQSHCELHRTQVRTEVSTGFCHTVQHV